MPIGLSASLITSSNRLGVFNKLASRLHLPHGKLAIDVTSAINDLMRHTS